MTPQDFIDVQVALHQDLIKHHLTRLGEALKVCEEALRPYQPDAANYVGRAVECLRDDSGC